MKSLKKNYIYNLIYQLLLFIFPLITVPYVSRILGTDGVGIYSYTYSISYYFVLMSMLGINNYGNRYVAKVRDDKDKLSKAFISIYSIQLFMSILMIIIYWLYVIIFDTNYKIVSLIQGIYLIATLLDINWFFFGLEEFKLTVTRNIFIKILSLIGIFLCVKTKSDVWLYSMILASSVLISNAVLIPFLLKRIRLTKIHYEDIKIHIKPVVVLFIPLIAVSLYKVMDKIMLGIISNVSEVGLYEQAEKIINMPLSLVTALGTVMLPRISNLVAKGEDVVIKKYIKKSIDFMMFMAFPICFGLIAVSQEAVPLLLGSDFAKSSIIIYFLAPTILFISFANVIRTQFLIPREKDNIFIISVIGGAVINLLLNILLIPKFASIGACIGTIAAELFVLLYQSYSVKKYLPIKDYIISIIPFFIKTIIMFIIVLSINLIPISKKYILIIQVLVGCLTYAILNKKYIIDAMNYRKK